MQLGASGAAEIAPHIGIADVIVDLVSTGSTLRVNGLALRWEELDEDIWVDDAVCGRFPRSKTSLAA